MIFTAASGDLLLLPNKFESTCQPVAIPLDRALSSISISLVHDVELKSWRVNRQRLAIEVRDPASGAAAPIYFEGEAAQAVTFEVGDRVDFILGTESVTFKDGRAARVGLCLWPTIQYTGPTNVSSTGMRYKPDEEQAILFKAGERHERSVAAMLRELGHAIPGPTWTGRVEIVKDQSFKRKRKPDLSCPICDRRFEVKSFLKPPALIRVSHSSSRPWVSENAPEDFHVFAHDNEMLIVSNAEIEGRWYRGRRASARYDNYWLFDRADINMLEQSEVECSRLRASTL